MMFKLKMQGHESSYRHPQAVTVLTGNSAPATAQRRLFRLLTLFCGATTLR
jgi:hypothetical protein